jgi:competence protein ComEC
VKCLELAAGDLLKIDGYSINVLHPESKRYLSLNDTSLVLKLEYGGHDMLFCGDIEKMSEADMLDKVENLESDVLKVPHHGSQTSASQDFLDKVSAKIAVIPCGRNVFGHPAAQMLEALEEARVYRTDLDGAVTVKIKKDEYKVETAVR